MRRNILWMILRRNLESTASRCKNGRNRTKTDWNAEFPSTFSPHRKTEGMYRMLKWRRVCHSFSNKCEKKSCVLLAQCYDKKLWKFTKIHSKKSRLQKINSLLPKAGWLSFSTEMGSFCVEQPPTDYRDKIKITLVAA